MVHRSAIQDINPNAEAETRPNSRYRSVDCASAFSGFYLALMIVLWLLIIRGTSIELRMHIDIGVWRSFFDGLFFVSSLLLAVFFGAALANVIRGVPLRADGYFFLPLWTNWRVGPEPGILDWYTVIGGVVALVALAIHGALYLAVKTEGKLRERARAFVRRFWVVLFAVTVISLPATIAVVRADTLANYRAYPVMFVIPLVVLLSLTGIIQFSRHLADRKAFASSCHYLSTMLVGAAGALYPRLLPSSNDPALDITVQNFPGRTRCEWNLYGGGWAWFWRLSTSPSSIACFAVRYRSTAAMGNEKSC